MQQRRGNGLVRILWIRRLGNCDDASPPGPGHFRAALVDGLGGCEIRRLLCRPADLPGAAIQHGDPAVHRFLRCDRCALAALLERRRPRGRLRVFLHGLYLGAVWWAIGQGVPAAISGIIAGLQPLMTAAIAPLLIGETLSRQQRLGLMLGFCGIALAVLPKTLAIDAASTPIHFLPVAVNVLGMAAVTCGTLYQKRYLQNGDIRSIAALQYVGALIVTVPLALMLEDLRVTWNLQLVAALAWSVLGLSMGAIALLLYLIRRGQVSRAASLIYLVPPLAALQAALFFGETLTWPMIVGTVIAVTGVYLTNRKTESEAAAGERPSNAAAR